MERVGLSVGCAEMRKNLAHSGTFRLMLWAETGWVIGEKVGKGWKFLQTKGKLIRKPFEEVWPLFGRYLGPLKGSIRYRSSRCGSAVTDPTTIHKVVGSIPGITQWVKSGAATSYSTECRCGSDPVLPWPWHRPQLQLWFDSQPKNFQMPPVQP